MTIDSNRTPHLIIAGNLRVILAALLCSIGSSAATSQARPAPSSAREAGLLQRMLDAEDARATDSASTAVLIAGLASPDVGTRQVAARAIGRIERRVNLALLEPALTDPSPAVRAEALNAIAQIAKADGPNGPPEGDARLRVWMGVQALIRGLIAAESDPTVKGVMARTLGRLPYPTEEVARGATESIAALIDGVPTEGALGREPWFGIAHGTDMLLRRFPSLRTAPGVLRVAQIPRVPSVAASASDSAWSRETSVILADIRGRVLAAAAGSADGLDDATARDIRGRFLSDFGDADPQVRRQVVALVPVANAIDDSSRARVVNVALRDPSFSVRVEAVRAFARRAPASCAPLLDATRDSNAHVALAAIDLAATCEPASAPVGRLSRLVRELPRGATSRSGTRPSWHTGAHALVSLARVAPDSARAAVSRFAAHPVWQVRMYAARAAGVLADTATLGRLAGDRSDNVRDAAVNALFALVRPSAGGTRVARIERTDAVDSIFVAQLARSDHQLILDAAKALQGARSSARIGEALYATLERLTRARSENSRDPRLELLARIEMAGNATQADRLQPYLSDYDPAIADRAVRLLRSWGVTSAVATPQRLQRIPVSLAELASLRTARVRVTMAPASGGGSFDMRLFCDEAPATINRFIALARRGYYNGLTFHRVETNFVIQGGSPGANEYVGADRFMRDELGLRSHERGTFGISTRGRDTGDAQIFANLIDNWRLDHDYTVFAEVVRGMDVVDAVLEGDVIARIEVLGAR
jgi:cyclophilin family peptidyl-prolyl cis-trans isomerase/HEAT repeat protein